MPLPKTPPSTLSHYLNEKSNLVSLYICSLSACVWILITNLLYYNFSTGGWDLALFSQLSWCLSKGVAVTTLYDGHFLTEHTSFIAYPISWIYKIAPHPLTLQYLKIISFFWSAYLLFKIAAKSLGKLKGLLLMNVYIFFPSNMGMLLGTFNFEPLMMPFILLAIKYLEERKYIPYLISLIIICLTKENLPLIAVMLGLYGFCVIKENRIRWGLIPALIGLIFFCTLNFVLIPYLRKDMPVHENIFWSRYSHLGSTPAEVLSSFLLHPLATFSSIFSKENIGYLWKLFGPEGIFTLFSPLILASSLPLLIKNLLSQNPLEKGILLYYSSTITCFIFWAYVKTFDRVKLFRNSYAFSLLILLSIWHVYSFHDLWNYQFFKKTSLSETAYIRHYITSQIPANAGVITSNRTMPQLSQRDVFYRFDFYLWGRHKNSKRLFKIPANVDYALFDIPAHPNKLDATKIKHLLFSPSWRVVVAIQNTVLLKRNNTDELDDNFILRKITNPTVTGKKSDLLFQNELNIANVQTPSYFNQKQRIFPVIITYQKIKKFKHDIYIELEIMKEGKVLYIKKRSVGYNIYPPSAWTINTTIAEKYNYWLPNLPLGACQITLKLVSNNESKESKFPILSQDIEIQ